MDQQAQREHTTRPRHGTSPSPQKPVYIPEGAVMVGRSLYVFADPELARYVLDGASPEQYGGRCVYYGYALSSRRTRRPLPRLPRRYRLRHPVRLVGALAGLALAALGLAGRRPDWILLSLLAFLAVGLHYRLTGGGSR